MAMKNINVITALLLVGLLSSCAVFKKKQDETAIAVSTSPSVNTVDKTVSANATGQIQIIDTEQFNKLLVLDEMQLVDVRTPKEFETGHIKDAINIDFNNEDFKSELSTLDKSKPVLVYCRSGKRSAGAAEIMKEMGFTKIVGLDGGMISWEAANLPTSKE
jgi:rhodanese-related sulfurtransferase